MSTNKNKEIFQYWNKWANNCSSRMGSRCQQIGKLFCTIHSCPLLKEFGIMRTYQYDWWDLKIHPEGEELSGLYIKKKFMVNEK